MLDDRVQRACSTRLEREDADEREQGVPREQRARQVARDDRAVPVRARRAADRLRGARDRRLARLLDDLARRRRPLPRRARALARGRPGQVRGLAERTSPRPGSRTGPSSSRATPSRRCRQIDDVFDVVFLDAEKDDYEALFALARPKLEPGAVVVADNVLSHADDARRVLAGPPGRPDARERHRPARPRTGDFSRPDANRYSRATAERRWSGSDRFKYGQWRYQRVEVRPRDLRGIA